MSTKDYGWIPAPYPHPYRPVDDPHNIMNSVRIPLQSFVVGGSGVDLSHVDKVRLYFCIPTNGEIYLDDIEFSR
ncbi:MAG: hypothetical protein ABI333_11075 [bacterium]